MRERPESHFPVQDGFSSSRQVRRAPTILWFSLLFPVFFPREASAQQVLWVKFGPFSSSFGNFLASAGDVDGDGRDDAIVGAHTWSGPTPATQLAGRVFLLSGATGATLWEAAGPVQSGELGSSVAGPGDLTGDGIPDVLVGSLDLGQARAYSGVDGSLVYAWSLPSYTSVGRAGDADGDGTPDVLVGTYTEPGGARVYSGATGLEIFALPGMGAGSGLGLAVEGLGDLTGDGLAEFIVGQPTNGNFATGQGNVFLHAGGSWVQFGQLSGPFGSYFGYDVARIGDVTGDGTNDFAVGARGVNSSVGEVRVFSGADLSLVSVLPGIAGNLYFGLSIDGPGDMDGDGVSDLAAGVLQGTPWGARVYSGADWSVIHEWLQPPGEMLGMGLDLAGCGDVNGDDFPDVLVGSPGSVGSMCKVRMFSGAPEGVSAFGSGCAVQSGGVPRIGATGAAHIGQTIRVNLSEVPPGKPTLLLLGLSINAWWGVPLPLDLAFAGLPGCALLISPDFSVGFTTSAFGPANGRVVAPLAIPNQPALAGATFHAQWYVVDPGPAPIPGGMTRALTVAILP